MLTKADPWPSYRVLQRSAQRLGSLSGLLSVVLMILQSREDIFMIYRNIVLISVFYVLEGVTCSEDIKRKALIACDLVLSLVDNIQETFGLSIAEAMAAGRPVVASDWDGYRDLIRNGIDGYLFPSCWDEQANHVSFPWDGCKKMNLVISLSLVAVWLS